MQVTPTSGTLFVLTADTQADRDLLDALRDVGTAGPVQTENYESTPHPDGRGFIAHRLWLSVDRHSAAALEAQAARQVLRAFTQLFRLGLGEKAVQWHVSPDVTNPDTKHQLASVLEKLDLVLQALRVAVGHNEVAGQAVVGTHGQAPVGDGSAILAEGGAA